MRKRRVVEEIQEIKEPIQEEIKPKKKRTFGKKTILIFGFSEFINQIPVNELIDKFDSVGINWFCESFPKVQYACYADTIRPNFSGQHVITGTSNQYNLADYDKKSIYQLQHGSEFSKDPEKLTMCCHSASIALNWAYQQGYERAVLIGVDLINGIKYFDSDKTFTMDEKFIKEAKNQLENLIPEGFEILQANPKSDMNIGKIDVKDLLDE